MQKIGFGDYEISFERVKSNAKRYTTIRVHPDKRVTVLSPEDTTDAQLTKIVQGKARWIIDKFQKIDEVKHTKVPYELVSGESFLYKGKMLRLKLRLSTTGNGKVYSDTTNLFCETTQKDNKEHIAKLLQNWYQEEAEGYLQNRTLILAEKFSDKPNCVRIKDQNKRWGSATAKKGLDFNWRIIMAPPSVIDYVIIHELAHLKHKNHTEDFWNTVKDIMPNYNEKKEWLRINGANLKI